MNNQQFWQITTECFRQSQGNPDTYQQLATEKLSTLPPESRQLFGAYASFYGYQAESNPRLMLLGKVIQGFVTDDSLLYFALWLVSCGEEIYFETLKNPDTLIERVDAQHFQAGLMPEFELLISLGTNNDGDEPITLEASELERIQQMYNEKIPSDNRTYYDLAREIETILPNTIRHFQFDINSIDFSYEEKEKAYYDSLKALENQTFETLKKEWTPVQPQVHSYDIPKPKRGTPIVEETIPPLPDSVLMMKDKFSAKTGIMQMIGYSWYNYKTGEEKEFSLPVTILMPGIFNYIAGNDEYLYYQASFQADSIKNPFCIYHIASGTFTYLPLPIDCQGESIIVFPNAKSGGYKKEKRGVFHQQSLYFSVSRVNSSDYLRSEIQNKDFIMRYNTSDNSLSVFQENASTPCFLGDDFYYLTTDEVLMCRNLITNRETVLHEKVTSLQAGNDRLYFVHPVNDNDYRLKSLYQDEIKEILIGIRGISAFSVVGHVIYLSLFLSQGQGGFVHGILLDTRRKTITEVPHSSQLYQFYLDEEKYIAIELLYEERSVIGRVHEVTLT